MNRPRLSDVAKGRPLNSDIPTPEDDMRTFKMVGLMIALMYVLMIGSVVFR